MARPDRQEKEIFKLLKLGKEDAVFTLYQLFREEFIVWSQNNYNLREDESADIFQDSVINVYFNIRNGKIVELSSSLKTYMFAIGKNLILKKIRKDQRIVSMENIQNFSIMDDLTDPLEANEEQKRIARLMGSMKEPCQSILKFFYFHNFSMKRIADTLGYKNQNVVKSQKLRCIKELKRKIDHNHA